MRPFALFRTFATCTLFWGELTITSRDLGCDLEEDFPIVRHAGSVVDDNLIGGVAAGMLSKVLSQRELLTTLVAFKKIR